MKRLFIIILSILVVGGCGPREKIMKDENTSPEIEIIEPGADHLLITWGSDAMDRGNHDYIALDHKKLVMDPQYETLERGDVIYYKMLDSEINKNPNIPENYLGRVVGLPGETVTIRYGHVYINNHRLDTFYGEATELGLTEEEFFQRTDLDRYENIDSWKAYFKREMDPVVVKKGTVFVLVDQWWRGTDSKDFGLLPVERIQGKVLGYAK